MALTKRIGIWLRVSTDMQVLGDSPQHHEQRARSYAEAKEWQIVEVYRLDAVSGKSVMGHPETKRMLSDIRNKHINGLVFSKLARLARNTKELLEFADIFRTENADLISLSENIDTSSPAGRLFFTIISAMAEWERDEIASRVAASVPVRAKLGKPLGGQASFGYKWEGKELVIDEKEAPVRKLLYELFLKHQRKKRTANELNALGYRTRNGAEFSDTTVGRLLRDTAAKGERRANYTKSTGEGKKWVIKPTDEWVVTACPPIVSSEVWNECNHILDTQERKNKRPGKTVSHLLSGFITCSCGKPMYVYHSAKVYVCKGCKNRVAVEDIDEIYQHYLKGYLSDINPTVFLQQSDAELAEKKALHEVTRRKHAELSKQVSELLNLFLEGKLTKETFPPMINPVQEQILQLEQQLPELEAEISFREIQLASSDTVLAEAKELYEKWHTMPFETKRAIVEIITDRIEIGKEDISITLSYLPSLSQKGGNSQHEFRGSSRPPA